MRIKKTSQTTPVQAEVVNTYSTSEENAYSTEYANKAFGGTLLWTNPNPTSAMAENTEINLSSSDYDVYEVFYMLNINDSNKQISSIKSIKGNGTKLASAIFSSNIFAVYRDLTRVSDTKFTTGTCYYGSSSVQTDNSRCVPLYIIGYKTGLFN